MINIEKKEYNEVLALINLMPSYDFYKIPTDKLFFLKKHSIKKYEVNKNDVKNNNLSRKAYVMYLQLYKEYIATEEEIKKIDDILVLNDKIKREKYKDVFKKKKVKENKAEYQIAIIEKESFFIRILNKLRRIFRK